MLRGVERRDIFLDDRDRRDLLDRLERVLPEARTRCFAWALMPNHVHLVLQTGPVPLARAMARIGTGYAQEFNRRHDRVGHLFQNRYKSILVGDEEQLLAVVRYVHLNPVRAGIVGGVDALGHYPWTGHAVLLGHREAPFQDTSSILARFGPGGASSRSGLLAWMCGEPESIASKAMPTDSAKPVPSPAPHRARAELAELVAQVCRTWGVSEWQLRSGSKARPLTDARAAIVQLACRELGCSGAEVGRELGLSSAAVSRLRWRRLASPDRQAAARGEESENLKERPLDSPRLAR